MQIAAFFDVDGTLTKSNVWRHFMAYFKTQKIRRKTHFFFTIYHYPIYYLRKTGLVAESAFRAIWADHLAWYLRGHAEADAEEVWDWIVADMNANHVWREDIRGILQGHLDSGHIVVLVSSGPAPLMRRLGQELGTPYTVGTGLQTGQGVYTGQSLKPICIDQYKASMAKSYLNQAGIEVDFEACYAYADSITDRGLLEMVGCPSVVYPDPELRTIAQKRGWTILPLEGSHPDA